MAKNEDLVNGKYTFVGVDVDATGRRISDEIVHLAAYTPNSQFDQYIIPVMNLKPAARQRHQLRVITVGFFRMLKCIQSNTVVKSKTEIAAVKSFLNWLESIKSSDPNSKGIILIYHERIKFIPYMLLEAVKRYDMFERFSNAVYGFADGYALTKEKCQNNIKFVSLRELAKLFLNYEENDDIENFQGNAAVRAKLVYEIVQHLAKGERETLNSASDITTDLIKDYVHTVKSDIDELDNQNKCLELQHTFRPIFLQYFKANLFHRYKAVTFRRVLSENGYDLNGLEEIWKNKGKDGLIEIITKLEDIKEENRAELVDLLDSYCDPEKELIVPEVKKPENRVRRRSQRRRGKGTPQKETGNNKYKNKDKTVDGNNNDDNNNNVKDNNNNGDSKQMTDSEEHSPRKHRRPRRRFNSKRQATKENDDQTKSKVVPDTCQSNVVNATNNAMNAAPVAVGVN